MTVIYVEIQSIVFPTIWYQICYQINQDHATLWELMLSKISILQLNAESDFLWPRKTIRNQSHNKDFAFFVFERT